MPRIVLVQVKRQTVRWNLSLFCLVIAKCVIAVDLSRRSLDGGRLMVKMGSFAR